MRRILRGKTVGVAGAGGLGSNCAVALARSGIGSLRIADFDVVSEANLDRQYYFLDQVGRPKVEALRDVIARVDPAVRVETFDGRIDPDSAVAFFAGCAVLVEAFDDAGAKAMLIRTALDRLPDMPVVAASGLAGWGADEDLKVRRFGRLTVIGDEERGVSDALPPMAPRVGAVACMQANEVLALLLGPMEG